MITSFTLVYLVKYFEIFLLELMATNFSPRTDGWTDQQSANLALILALLEWEKQDIMDRACTSALEQYESTTLSQMTNFGRFQTETVCRKQF